MWNRCMIYAGFYKRLLAHNIDLIPILFLLYLSTFTIPNMGWDWAIFGFIYISYHVGFEWSTLQGTPGKKWLKIKVVSESGPLRFMQSLIRNLSKGLSLILLFGGFILILFNVRRKALHDYLAGTVVLFDENLL